MPAKTNNSSNQVMLRFLLGVLALVGAVLGGIGINTVCGYGDLRVQVAAIAGTAADNEEDIKEIRAALKQLDLMNRKMDRISARLGIRPEPPPREREDKQP